MRIQHNIMAMNSYRNYNVNTGALSRNLEKLSSGYKINRAGDDVAGLAISEKLRAQISGLKQAQSNVKDGISLVKTAEGALQEVQDMMNRMVTLATQSANGTYDNKVDRNNLQKEVESLKAEIDRIADSSNFNGTKLLDGSLDASAAAATVTVGAEGTEIQDKLVAAGTGLTKATIAAANAKFEFTAAAGADTKFASYEISFTDNEGNSYTFNMVADTANSGAVADTANATAIIDGLNAGTGFALSALGTTGDGGEAVAKFRELFTASTNGNKVVITAKDADSTATVDSVKQAESATAAAAAPANGTAAAITATPASEAYDVYDIGAAQNNTAYKISINDKEYTYTSDADATIDEIYSGLAKALKADGYDVELVDDATGKVDTATSTNNTAIKFSDPSQLKENQKGVQIVNTTSDKWEVDATVSAKGSTAIMLGTPTEKDVTAEFTVNYVNANNEAVTKTFEYNTGSSANDAANNLKAAMAADEDFAAAFGITAATDTITLAHNGSGTTYGVTSVSTTDKAGATVSTTGAADTGKALSLATGKTLVDGDQITIDGKTYESVTDTSKSVADGVTKVALDTADTDKTMKNLQAALKKNGVEATYDTTTDKLIFADNQVKMSEEGKGGLTLQIGDTADSFNQLTVSVGDMHVKALGIGDIDISNQEGAAKAVETIKNAINTVSSTRGDLGAIQNRLEHTTNNLAIMTENIQDAESTIRDVDIADEMTTYTKNNILLQSAQAMLAQANQMPQGVLQLLQ